MSDCLDSLWSGPQPSPSAAPLVRLSSRRNSLATEADQAAAKQVAAVCVPS